jgi:lysyl-tRNA synthetase class I
MKAPTESKALREARRALRWLKRAEKSLAAHEKRERKQAAARPSADAPAMREALQELLDWVENNSPYGLPGKLLARVEAALQRSNGEDHDEIQI